MHGNATIMVNDKRNVYETDEKWCMQRQQYPCTAHMTLFDLNNNLELSMETAQQLISECVLRSTPVIDQTYVAKSLKLANNGVFR